jgi:hypothetical protein
MFLVSSLAGADTFTSSELTKCKTFESVHGLSWPHVLGFMGQIICVQNSIFHFSMLNCLITLAQPYREINLPKSRFLITFPPPPTFIFNLNYLYYFTICITTYFLFVNTLKSLLLNLSIYKVETKFNF